MKPRQVDFRQAILTVLTFGLPDGASKKSKKRELHPLLRYLNEPNGFVNYGDAYSSTSAAFKARRIPNFFG